MSGYTHPFSGPQDPSGLSRQNQSRDARTFNQQQLPPRAYARMQNNTGPVYLGHPPAQVDMPPPVRQPRSEQLQRMHSGPRLPNPRQEYYRPVHPAGQNYGTQSNYLELQQPPELPPKNLSGLHTSPEPQRYAPPLPARPNPQLAPDPPHSSFSSEKKPRSGRVGATDPGLSDALEELKRDPVAAAERFKKVAEVMSTWPKRYESGLHTKTKRLQECVSLAQHDLDILKEELHKARSSLSAAQTGGHVLKGQMEMLEQENAMLRSELSKTASGDGEADFSNEETQLLISDLRSQIVKLKSEVPDPNFIDSLRLIIQLLQEDKKILEKKYTEVSDELHNRDNEISRLMKESQTSGCIIPEGKTGMEKHFDSQMEELRRQNGGLRQQLLITEQKLEVSEKRDSAEKEPGPSKVELQNMIQHAQDYREQLQANLEDKDKELKQLKMHLESTREVMSSASTQQVSGPGYGAATDGGQVLALEIEKQQLVHENQRLEQENQILERELGERRRGRQEGEGMEMELRGEREKVRILEGRVRQMEASAKDYTQDKNKESLIETLLGDRNALMEENESLKQSREDVASLQDGVSMMRNYLEGRDAHIQVLNETIEQKKQECLHYKKQYEEFNLRSNKLLEFGNEVNEEKVALESVVHKYKQRIAELEAKVSSIQSVAPSASTAAEVYDVQMMELSKDLSACELEKNAALEKCIGAERKNEELSQQLHQLNTEFANLKNQSHLPPRYGGYGYAGYADHSARYAPPHAVRPSPGPHGHGPAQPRDSGVDYT